MKNILLLLLSLPLFAFGQKSPAALEAYASPNYSYYTKPNSLINDDGKLSFQFGLGLVLPAKNEHLHWLAGTQISSFGSKYDSGLLMWGTQHNGMGGFNPNLPSGEQVDAVTFIKDHYFLEVPLGLRYYLRRGKISLFVQPALSPMLYLTTRHLSKYSLAGKTQEKTVEFDRSPGFRSLNLFGSLGAGVEFSLSERMRLQFMPQAGIQALSISKESQTGTRFYAAGVQVGVSYRVKQSQL